jgi:uncharacterized membrane protein YqiK
VLPSSVMQLALLDHLGIVTAIVVVTGLILLLGFFVMIAKFYQKVEQGTAIVRTGMGGINVSFNGIVVIPVLHRSEVMDISLKRVEIFRHGSEGLICKDNVRADIKVAFFVRVNNQKQDVLTVAQSIGCKRASDNDKLVELFDAKFSEALKTVGKKFDFTELYTERDRFKESILQHIGTDLNGYVLDDAAIDYLEQTDVNNLDPNNILDAEGIKKITDLTAREAVFANNIAREKEKTIKKQDVEAKEAILELERQQAEAEARQEREIQSVKAREKAQWMQVAEEERIRGERARISTDEELGIAEENRQRTVIVAMRNKERTDAIEQERVKREQHLEAVERERVVELARIEKEKALEAQRKAIQDVIRERVVVERAVVEEQERIKDTQEFAEAERRKKVVVVAAQASAEEALVKQVKEAEAREAAAKHDAAQVVVHAESKRAAAEKEAQAKKLLAEATAAEHAAEGLAEAEVLQAKAGATQKYGAAEAEVIAKKGHAEAEAMRLRFAADAEGTAAKADAMKKLDGVGRDHEEFKLRLDRDLQVELAQINIARDIAAEQAKVLAEAMKSARIDIVGGEGAFFQQIMSAITSGKKVERLVGGSDTLQRVRDTFFAPNGNGHDFREKLRQFLDQFGMSSDDVKNLTIAAAIGKMMKVADTDGLRGELRGLLGMLQQNGLDSHKVDEVLR